MTDALQSIQIQSTYEDIYIIECRVISNCMSEILLSYSNPSVYGEMKYFIQTVFGNFIY